MTRKVFFVFAAGVFWVASFGLDCGWSRDRFLVMFEPEPKLVFKSCSDGIVRCGIEEIDALMERFRVRRAKRIFPEATNPRVKRLRYPVRNQYLLVADVDSADIPRICEEFRKCPYVRFADPNYWHPILREPNDPYYHLQWYLEKIEAPNAWNYITGCREILVTTLEGVEWYHPDLYDNLWVNPGEDLDSDGVPFDPDDINGVDDDGNGYVDDFIGWDFIDDDDVGDEVLDPTDEAGEEDNDPDDCPRNGHGTHTTGVLAAVANNSVGIAGLNWRASIVCLRTDVTPASGIGHHISAAVIQALQYAREMEQLIDVFSLSYGDTFTSTTERYYLNQVYHAGGVLFGGAGNDAVSTRFYPAAYSMVIAVAATDQYDRRAYFSNYGDWIDVSAPGVAIYSTVPDSDYIAWDGTSMATPVAAGIGALLRCAFPDSANDWIRERIEYGTDNIDDLNPEYAGLLGSGRVNAFKALFQWRYPYLLLDSFVVVDGDGDGRVTQGEEGELVIYVHNDPEWQPGEDIVLTVTSDDSGIVFIDSVAELGSIAPGACANNAADPIRFTMSPDEPWGHPVEIKLLFTSSSSDFEFERKISFMLGWAPVLVYDCDGGDGYEFYICKSLERGQVVYDVWHRDSAGPLDPELATNFFKTFIVLTGDLDTNVFSPEEISLFESLADMGKDLILTGQYAPDFLADGYEDFLADYFGVLHDEDAVLRVWTMDIRGVEGDPVGDGLRLNAFASSDAAGNQFSAGACFVTGTDAMGFLRYYSDPYGSRYCAVRKELPSGAKTMLFEFGLEGVTNGSVGYSDRDSLVANMVRWLGYEYVGVSDGALPQPRRFAVRAFPNPFNSTTTIAFPASGYYCVEVYDFCGRLVRLVEDGFGEGEVSVVWDGRDDSGAPVPAGMYLVCAKSGANAAVTKVVLVK